MSGSPPETSQALVPYTPQKRRQGDDRMVLYESPPLIVQNMGVHSHSHGDDVADDESHDIKPFQLGHDVQVGSHPNAMKRKFETFASGAGTWVGGTLGGLFGPEGQVIGAGIGNRVGKAAGGFVYDAAHMISQQIRDHVVRHLQEFGQHVRGRVMGYAHRLIRGASDVVLGMFSRGQHVTHTRVQQLKDRVLALATNRGNALALTHNNPDPQIGDASVAWLAAHGHQQRHAAQHAMHHGQTHLTRFYENDIYSAFKAHASKHKARKRKRPQKKKSSKRSRR